MHTHNGTSDAVRAVLSDGGSFGVRELTEAVTAAGLQGATENGVRRVLDQRCAVGEFLKERENGVLVYRLNPDWSGARKGPAPRAADPSQVSAAVQAIGEKVAAAAPKPLAAGLGAAIGSARKRSRERGLDAAVRALFVDRLSPETAYSPRDVAQELEGTWRVQEVAIALYEGVTQGWLRHEFSEDERDNVFQWATPEAVAFTAPAADEAALPPVSQAMREAPAVAYEPTPVAAIPGIGDVEPLAARPAPLMPLAMGERLAAIAADLEDAIGDACDGQLPHDLIKALTVANGATHRALRTLAA